MKRLFFLLVFVLFLSSCRFLHWQDDEITPENDNSTLVYQKNLSFTNLSADYSITNKSITTYYVNNENVPYVDVIGYITSLNGYFDCGSSLRYVFLPDKNMLVVDKFSGDNIQSYVQFQWDRNYIYFSDYNFIDQIIKSNQTTNYGKYLKYVDYYSSSKKPVGFNIGSYHFDILYWNSKCLVPFVIINMLLNSQNHYNIYYTPNGYYGYWGEISRYSEEYKTIYINDSNGKTQTKAMRNATVNSFLFAMDRFYGLKKNKDIKYFNQYISDEDFDLLFSTNAEDNHEGLKHIIYGKLDELHTRIDGRSIYSSNHNGSIRTLDECGEFTNKFYETDSLLTNLRKEKLGEDVLPVRFYGDTAIITFDSFVTASDDVIYDSEGYIKDTAWKYDTYFFMRYCMKQIKNHTEIKDVLIDLSLNGGGNFGALQRSLGFLTDIVIKDYRYNTLTNEYSCDYFKVDTDGDGYYDDDAYDQYRWTILSSICTFSAANNFVCKAKQQNFAKVIGNASGGGMCSVLSLVLADGTPISISSNNTLRYVKREDGTDVYYSTEDGFSPQLEIPYSDYYDDAKLVQYIDNVYNI